MFKFVHRALLGVLLLIRLSPAGSFEFCPLPGASLPWPENVGSSKHLQWRNISNHLTSNLDQIVYSALQINPNQTLDSTKTSSDALLSIEVTTRKGSVYTYNFGRTAALNGTGQGSQHDITNDSVFRIASVTKTFTAFEVLKRKLNLEASILEYLSGLETLNPEGIQNWDGVDVRSLGSALSGVSRDLNINDLAARPDFAKALGLPDLPETDLPSCDFGDKRQCNKTDFLSAIANAKLVSPPYSKPLYSNSAFSLLGYALEQESGESFGTLLEQDVFSPLNMDRTTTKLPPSDQKEYDTWLERGAFGDEAVLASYIASEGTSEANGGMYSTTSDLSKFLRSILHGYKCGDGTCVEESWNSTNGSPLLSSVEYRKWLSPSSFTTTNGLSVGMPWEIYRPVVPHVNYGLPISFYSKGGDLPGYNSLINVIPEYGIGVVVLLSGSSNTPQTLQAQLFMDVILKHLLPSIEAIQKDEAKDVFAGRYAAGTNDSDAQGSRPANSSISIEVNSGPGLEITSWTVNGTNFLESVDSILGTELNLLQRNTSRPVRITPSGQDDEWRLLLEIDEPSGKSAASKEDRYYNDVCNIWFIVGAASYGGRPLDLLKFGRNEEGRVDKLELSAFREVLQKEE